MSLLEVHLTCLSKQAAKLLLNMSRCLSNAVQPGRTFSLNLIVVVFVSRSVSLCQVDVALTFSVCTALSYIVVPFFIITFATEMFIFRHQCLFSSTSSYRICCISCGITVYEQVVSETTMIEMFSVYPQTPAFPGQSSEWALDSVMLEFAFYLQRPPSR